MDFEDASQLAERALKTSGTLWREMRGRTVEAMVKKSIHPVVTEADLESERKILHTNISNDAFEKDQRFRGR